LRCPSRCFGLERRLSGCRRLAGSCFIHRDDSPREMAPVSPGWTSRAILQSRRGSLESLAPRPARRRSAEWGGRKCPGRRCRTDRDATMLSREHARATRFPSDVPSSPPRLPFAGRNSVTSPFPSRLGERLETIEAVKAGRTSHHCGIRLLPDGRKVGRGRVSAVVTEHNCHSAPPRRPCRQPTLTLSFRKQPSFLR
jgi:hypothetical protein